LGASPDSLAPSPADLAALPGSSSSSVVAAPPPPKVGAVEPASLVSCIPGGPPSVLMSGSRPESISRVSKRPPWVVAGVVDKLERELINVDSEIDNEHAKLLEMRLHDKRRQLQELRSSLSTPGGRQPVGTPVSESGLSDWRGSPSALLQSAALGAQPVHLGDPAHVSFKSKAGLCPNIAALRRSVTKELPVEVRYGDKGTYKDWVAVRDFTKAGAEAILSYMLGDCHDFLIGFVIDQPRACQRPRVVGGLYGGETETPGDTIGWFI